MVRENYLLPPLPPGQTYGLLDFADLRLIVDPHATGPDRGSVGTRVMSKVLRRGGNLSQYNFKVQPEHPVPCEAVGQELVAVEGAGCVGLRVFVNGWMDGWMCMCACVHVCLHAHHTRTNQNFVYIHTHIPTPYPQKPKPKQLRRR